MRSLRKSFSYIGLLLLLVTSLRAEEPTKPKEQKPDEEITVTAARYPQPLKNTPVKVTIISEEDINNANPSALDEILKLYPETYPVFPAFAARQKREVTLRGFPGEGHTLVLLDGIPINSARDFVPWSIINPQSVQRVEMVSGPLSSLYGSGAMGGVINIITKEPQKPRETVLQVSGGNLGTNSLSLFQAGKNSKISYSLAARTYNSDGYIAEKQPKTYNSERDREDLNLMGKLAYQLNDDSHIKLSWTNGSTDFNKGRTYNSEKNKANLINIGYQGKFDSSEITASLFYNDVTSRVGVDKPPAYNVLNSVGYWSPEDVYGLMIKMILPVSKSQQLLCGIEQTYKNFELKTEYQTAYRVITAQGTQQRTGLYLSDEIKLDDHLIGTIGMRYESWKSYGGSYTDTTGPVLLDYDSHSDSASSPKIGLVYHLNKNTILRTSAGYGINVPDPTMLYSVTPVVPQIYGNPDLKPERLVSYEIGINHQFTGNLIVKLASYLTYADDLLGLRQVSPTRKNRGNFSEATISGLETGIEYQINPAWSALLSNTNNKSVITDDKSTPSYKGNDLRYAPRNKALLQLGFTDQTIGNLKLAARYLGRQYDNFENTVRLDDHLVSDISYNRKLSDAFNLTIGVENVFNRKYDIPAGGDPAIEAPGRLITLGLKTEF